jgi:lipoic acid synthetase
MNKPNWLRVRCSSVPQVLQIEELLKGCSLHTVCQETACPNLVECFSRKTATFMILGRVCTRNCTFCNVVKGFAEPVAEDEPDNIAKAVKELGLKHVVITSVTRDDLPDGGSNHFRKVVQKIKELDTSIVVEVLIPDFQGDQASLWKVVEAGPDVINHNVETVAELYPSVRPIAVYRRSLNLLENVKGLNAKLFTKSGIILGLGEREAQVIRLLEDLRSVDCDFLTIGQYLAPSGKHHPVVEYIHPDVFRKYRELGVSMGFKYVASAPLVRSSYRAEEVYKCGKVDAMVPSIL